MKFEFIEDKWQYRQMVWSLDDGRKIQMIWPSNLGIVEYSEAREAIEAQLKTILRVIEEKDKHAPMFVEPNDPR